jgi:hypothetical protein
LLKVLEDEGQPIGMDSEGRGYIAPFRAQINLADTHLPTDFVKDTVHKFQGRECDEIVFSTVLDKKRYNQMQTRLDFVDDPHMINVAVSRAKHRFTFVTGDEVFTGNNGHIAALIRYISYTRRTSRSSAHRWCRHLTCCTANTTSLWHAWTPACDPRIHAISPSRSWNSCCAKLCRPRRSRH